MTTPSASRTSAAPPADEAARLPCLTPRAPAAAATIAPMVEMFTGCAPSPPVPTRSTRSPGTLIGVALRSMTSESPATSPGVSPFIRRATANPATWTGVAAPSMISFIAQAASSWLRVSPRISAPMRARQLSPGGAAGRGAVGSMTAPSPGRSAAGLGGQVLGPLAHQACQGGRERDRVDRVTGHGVGTRPGGEPAVVHPAYDEQHRRAVVDLVLGLAAHPHAARRLGFAVQHHDVGAACVEQADERRLGGDRNDLRLGHVGGGTAPDGKLYAGAGVRVMAVDNDLHEVDGTDTGGRPARASGVS